MEIKKPGVVVLLCNLSLLRRQRPGGSRFKTSPGGPPQKLGLAEWLKWQECLPGKPRLKFQYRPEKKNFLNTQTSSSGGRRIRRSKPTWYLKKQY
jgi:hypothetical protein